MKKPYWTPGNVVEIVLPQSKFSYGIVLSSPLMGFFDVRSDTPLKIDQISSRTFLFGVWVMKHAIGKDGWKIIGQLPLTDEMKEAPWFFKRDAISGKLTRYRHPQEIPASEKECKGLECAAVWDPAHIESRLSDHFEGRQNKWVELFALK